MTTIAPNICSHPKVPLIYHLARVANEAAAFAERAPLPGTLLSRRELVLLARIAGACHDLGKATRFFQRYLHHPKEPTDSRKNHAHPSAIIAWYLATRLTEQAEEPLTALLAPLLVYTAVRRHHGNLKNLGAELHLKGEDIKLLCIQLEALPAAVGEMIQHLLGSHMALPPWEQVQAELLTAGFAKKLKDSMNRLEFESDWPDMELAPRLEAFYSHQWLYGCLLRADKEDCILEGPQTLPPLPYTAISDYREHKGWTEPKREIDQLKNRAYTGSLAELERVFDPGQGFYSVTLPTGLGKTMTSLALGFKMAALAGMDDPRIVICIPFTSIIDQNAQVYEEVLQQPGSDLLLLHHHRAEPDYKRGEDSQPTEDQSQFLIETWQSRVIISTFVQLLETIFSASKTRMLKLPALANAIVMLDEVQQIPWSLWEPFKAACQALHQRFGTRFILLTATQPLIFTPGEEIRELVPDYPGYFRYFDRTQLHNHTEEAIDKEEYYEFIRQYGQAHPGKNLLIILNTKGAALDCLRKLRDTWPDYDTDFRLLSTYRTPKERQQVIAEIKAHDAAMGRLVVVSTQLVEAGVDISVQAVFRQLAPLDSIIQAAGRANRYNEQGQPADVFLHRISDWAGASARVYGADLLQKTLKVLTGFTLIPERDFLGRIEAYFAEVRQFADADEHPIFEALQQLEYGTVGEFRLIEERETESIFVELDEAAASVWQRYCALMDDQELSPMKRKKQFRRFRNQFYDYVINVALPFGESQINMDLSKERGYYHVELNSHTWHYSYDPDNPAKCEGYLSDPELN